MEQVKAKAYLTLPILGVPLSSNPGPLRASFSVDSAMIPLEWMNLTQKRLQLFKAATNILNLHPYDPDEDETVWEDKSETNDYPNPYEDADSEGSEDDEDDDKSAENDTRKSDMASIQGESTAGALSSDVKSGTQSGLCNEHGQRSAMINFQNQKVDDNAPGSKTKEAVGDKKVGAGSKEKEIWPQLMILGCGELQAHDTPEAEW